MEFSAKNVLLKSRISWGKILIVGNNNKTKVITIEVLTIFVVNLYNFIGVFLIQKRKPSRQNALLLSATWDSAQLCKKLLQV